MADSDSPTPGPPPAPKQPKSGWLNVLIDWAPVLVFLGVYYFYAPADKQDSIGILLAVVRSTGAFILAAILALAASRFLLGHVSRMLILSTSLIIGFGLITIILRDPVYIQIKPTAFYVLGAGVLLGGWLKGKAFLQWLLDAAFEGLSDEGWLKLSRNWGIFFVFLAFLNEGMRHALSFGQWVALKLPVFGGLSFLFIFTQLPMLLRHGLSLEDKAEVLENPPIE